MASGLRSGDLDFRRRAALHQTTRRSMPFATPQQRMSGVGFQAVPSLVGPPADEASFLPPSAASSFVSKRSSVAALQSASRMHVAEAAAAAAAAAIGRTSLSIPRTATPSTAGRSSAKRSQPASTRGRATRSSPRQHPRVNFETLGGGGDSTGDEDDDYVADARDLDDEDDDDDDDDARHDAEDMEDDDGVPGSSRPGRAGRANLSRSSTGRGSGAASRGRGRGRGGSAVGGLVGEASDDAAAAAAAGSTGAAANGGPRRYRARGPGTRGGRRPIYSERGAPRLQAVSANDPSNMLMLRSIDGEKRRPNSATDLDVALQHAEDFFLEASKTAEGRSVKTLMETILSTVRSAMLDAIALTMEHKALKRGLRTARMQSRRLRTALLDVQQAILQAKFTREQLSASLEGEQGKHGALAEADHILRRLTSLLERARDSSDYMTKSGGARPGVAAQAMALECGSFLQSTLPLKRSRLNLQSLLQG